jgi:hypothetical protein
MSIPLWWRNHIEILISKGNFIFQMYFLGKNVWQFIITACMNFTVKKQKLKDFIWIYLLWLLNWVPFVFSLTEARFPIYLDEPRENIGN